MRSYLIIGASAAGLSAAQELRAADPQGKITVLTAEEYLPYSRPSISYYLKSKVSEEDIYLRPAEFYSEKKIDVFTGARVTGLDPAAKTVTTADGRQFSYDKLCLATGSHPFVPPTEGVEGKENVVTFLDFASAKRLKEMASPEKHAVVIGAGLIGMKAAEGLVKLCKSVTVVELAESVLPSILDANSAVMVKEHLEENGISILLGNTVTRADSQGDTITSVELKNGEKLPCDLLVMAVGVRPETALAEKAGLRVERGITVDPETMQTSDPDIYAAGDCVTSVDMLDGSKKIIALWPNAVQQGKIAARQMAGKADRLTENFSVNAIDFFGLRICTCGLIHAAGDPYRELVRREGSVYKRLIVKENKLVGFVLINCIENAGIYTALIRSGTDLSTLQGDLMDMPTMLLYSEAERTSLLLGGEPA